MNEGAILRERLPEKLVTRYMQERRKHRLTSPKACYYVAKADEPPSRCWVDLWGGTAAAWREKELLFVAKIEKDKTFRAGDFYGRFSETWREGAIRLDPVLADDYSRPPFFVPETTAAEHREVLRALGYGKHEAWVLGRRYVQRDMELIMTGQPIYEVTVSVFLSDWIWEQVFQFAGKAVLPETLRLAVRMATGFTTIPEAQEHAELCLASARAEARQELSFLRSRTGTHRN
jgi:hypothetical protein